MIFKHWPSTILGLNRLLNSKLKNVHLISKYSSRSNSFANACHSKAIQRFCCCIDKHYSNNLIVPRLLHLHAVEKDLKLSDTSFFQDWIQGSEVYSNSFPSSLTLDQDLQAEQVSSILEKQWISMTISEMLQNLQHVSIYAAKNLESINDSKYNGILQIVTNKLPNFNDEEIHCLFACLACWKFEKPKSTYKSLIMALDNKCLKRMGNWSIDEKLLTNTEFFKLRMLKRVEFAWHSLNKMGFKSKNMTPANLVQYAFLIKFSKMLSIRMCEIEYRMEQHFDNYSIEELAIIAMAFCKYEVAIRSNMLLSKILHKVLSEMDNINDIVLKSVMEIIAYRSQPEIKDQLEDLLATLENHASRFHVNTLVNILKLQTRLLMYNEQLMSKILSRCEQDVKSLRLKDLETILLTLHTFNYDPKTTPLYSMIYNELIDLSRANDVNRNPSLLIRCAMYMTKQQFYPQEILKWIFDHDFIQQVYNSNFYKVEPSYLAVDFNIELEHAEYSGPRARKDCLLFLMKFYGSIKRQRFKKTLPSDKFFKEISDIVQKMTNSETVTHVDTILPHVSNSWLILCYDSETKEFLSPSSKLDNIPPDVIKYAPDDGKKWYAIVVGTNRCIIRDESHKVTGTLATEIRQLERIGYTPVMIRLHEWNDLTHEEKIKYVENFLNNVYSLYNDKIVT